MKALRWNSAGSTSQVDFQDLSWSILRPGAPVSDSLRPAHADHIAVRPVRAPTANF